MTPFNSFLYHQIYYFLEGKLCTNLAPYVIIVMTYETLEKDQSFDFI